MTPRIATPRILIIAGSDSGGGAGIQADIKTVTMLGGHAMTAVTAITAQNTLGVQRVFPLPTDLVADQFFSVIDDIGVDAIKIGMLGRPDLAEIVWDLLLTVPPGIPIVLDPVMVATSGDSLNERGTAAAMHPLLDLATVVTPNLHELDALGGEPGILAHGCALLVKGGHGDGAKLVDRLVTRDGEIGRWESDRIETTSTHGTGCTLASAIATYLAYGYQLEAAIARARQFVRIALKDAPGLGGGHGPMGHQKVRLDLGPGVRLNQVTVPIAAGSEVFYRTLGLTQIVDTEDGHYARFEAAGGATLSIEHGAAPTLFFECENLDAEVERLQAADVVFDQLPTEQAWRWREARLTDPAGNTICLYQADENRRYPPWRLPT